MRALIPALIGHALLAAQASAQTVASDHRALIENALSAAPASVAAGATVADFQNNILREGTNGWVCMPDDPNVPNNSPMCLDAAWRDFVDAWLSKRTPESRSIGIAYMLQGDMPVSNIDPFATGPTADNHWVQNAGPHIMLLVPDPKLLEQLPADPDNGGPWVMWKGTPYAHVMVPTVPRQR